MDIEDLIDGLAGKEMTGRGNWVALGFLGLVEMIGLKPLPKGYKGKSAIFEFKVLTTNKPESDPAGCTRSQVVKLDGDHAAKEIKQIMFAINGVEPSSVPSVEKDPEVHKEIMAEFKKVWNGTESIAGMKAQLEGTPYQTKGSDTKKSQLITINKWSPAPEAAAEQKQAA